MGVWTQISTEKICCWNEKKPGIDRWKLWEERNRRVYKTREELKKEGSLGKTR